MSRSACAADWMSNLPLVLLGLRAATRQDAPLSPAHLVYGCPLRLPGEFFSSDTRQSPAKVTDFVLQLQQAIRGFRPAPIDFHTREAGRENIPLSLRSSSSVFVRVDAVKRPLTQPYVGPFAVLERGEKTFVLSRAGKPWTVSVDRLKPFFTYDMSASPASTQSSPSPPSTQCALPPAASAAPTPALSIPAPSPANFVTRAGRTIRPPARFST